METFCSISASSRERAENPSKITVFAYGGKRFRGELYPALVKVEGNSLRDTFDGLVKYLGRQ